MTDPLTVHESLLIDGERVHRTRPMTEGERGRRLAEESTWEAERLASETAETEERTNADRALAALDVIENGTAVQALAALRIAVPWLVRQQRRG